MNIHGKVGDHLGDGGWWMTVQGDHLVKSGLTILGFWVTIPGIVGHHLGVTVLGIEGDII